MADFEPPSFSLGFDFDTQIDPTQDNNKPVSNSNHFPEPEAIIPEDPDEDFETLTVVDSDIDDLGSVPKLKRLRRGCMVREREPLDSSERKGGLCCSVVVDDDDIDEFSSEEDEHLSTHRPSVCNSSKIPLNGHGVLTKQSGKRKQNVLNDPESVITSCNKPPFPKLTTSPLRRFQLLDSDSDSDDPFISKGTTNKACNGSESSLNISAPECVQRGGLNEQRKLNESVSSTTREDLWEDFRPLKSFRIPTPALDEFCEEYFSSMKDKSKAEPESSIRKNNENINVNITSSVIDLGDPRPPAHQYFFHVDQRIQDLVRTRLPNFYPLNAANRDSKQPSTSNIDYMGQFSHSEKSKHAARTNKAAANRDSTQPSTSNIDYMGQFNHGEKPKQAARTNKAETRTRKNSRKSKAQETSQRFVNPKVNNTQKKLPKDAGKRRVQADGQAASAGAGVGHWFTNQDGKRVYVSNNGQELTGRAAYMLYKK
ncbi:hypothetical protein M8C21_015568, partial [Ambrosia artemisiifolia]